MAAAAAAEGTFASAFDPFAPLLEPLREPLLELGRDLDCEVFVFVEEGAEATTPPSASAPACKRPLPAA